MFGPLFANCEHNHRSQVKCWGLVLKCTTTAAVSIYAMAKYDSSAFLQAYTRHASRYGHPSTLVIDAGSQLVKGCNEMEMGILDVHNITRIQHKVGATFEIVPVGSHYQNGMVERSIKEIRALFLQMYRGLKLDLLSFETAFAWIGNELNNFPVCLGSRTSNLDKLDVITPARLIHGRNNRRCLSGPVTLDVPTRLMKQMKDTEEAWWKSWSAQRLGEFIPGPKKWKEGGGPVGVGDIVLMVKKAKDMVLGEPIWRIGRVVQLSEGRDGEARQATVEYRNATENGFRKVILGVRQLAVLHHEGELDLVDALNEAARLVNFNLNIQQNVVNETEIQICCVNAQLSSSAAL